MVTPRSDFDSLIIVRATKAEKQYIEHSAFQLGMSVSEYCRMLVGTPIESTDSFVDAYNKSRVKINYLRFIVFDKDSNWAFHYQANALLHHYNAAVSALDKLRTKRFLSAKDTSSYIESIHQKLELVEDYRKEYLVDLVPNTRTEKRGNRDLTFRFLVPLTEDIRLRRQAGSFNISLSSLVRALVFQPTETSAAIADLKNSLGTRQESDVVFLFDFGALSNLTKLVRKWGIEYDRAVHALATIASKHYIPSDKARELFEVADNKMTCFFEQKTPLDNAIHYVAKADFIEFGR